MNNRNLLLKDKNKNKISENDELVIRVSELTENADFFRSNLGKKCLEDKITKIEIKINNSYPLLKVDYSILFLPTKELIQLNDYTFLRYISTECENITKTDGVDPELAKGMPIDFKHKDRNICVGDKFVVNLKDEEEVKKVFNKEFYENNQNQLKNITKLVFEISNNDFLLKVDYKLMVGNKILTNQDVWGSSEEEAATDKFYKDDFVSSSMPFKNHGEGTLSHVLKVYQDNIEFV